MSPTNEEKHRPEVGGTVNASSCRLAVYSCQFIIRSWHSFVPACARFRLMDEQTARTVTRIRARLRHTIRRLTLADLAFGGIVSGGGAASLWIVITLLEAGFWLGPTVRTALVGSTAITVLGIAGAFLGRPLARVLGVLPDRSEEQVARAVGDQDSKVDDRLLDLLQLAEGKGSRAPPPLVNRAVQELAHDLEDTSFEEVEDFDRARRALRYASLPLLGILAFLLVAPSTFLGASERLLAPGTEFSRPVPFTLSVSPGDVQLVTGDTLHVSAQASGEIPSTATLLLQDSSGTVERVALQPDAMGRFEHAVPNVRHPLRYRFVASPVRTPWHSVEVLARPLVQQLQLTVHPPTYTGRSARTLNPNVGDVEALPGTRVDVSARPGGPSVETARLAFESGRVDTLHVADGTAKGTFTVRRDDSYQLHLQSQDGISNRDPIRYDIALRPDRPPSISFTAPESPSSLEADLTTSLDVRIRDDFGFRRLALFYRVSDRRFGGEQPEYQSLDLPLSTPDQTRQSITYDWLLAQDTGLDPQPGDEITYYVKVWDNDIVSGPKSDQTQIQRLQMPSVSDRYDQLNETAETAEEQIAELREQSESAREQFQSLRRELRRTREANWRENRGLQQLQNRQESVEKTAESLSRQLREMSRQMQREEMSLTETAEQVTELQRIAEDLSSPEVQKALQKLKKALEREDPEEMQNALNRVQKRQEAYDNRLERTKELFERLKTQQKLEQMADRTKSIEDTQKALEKETTRRMSDSLKTEAASDSAQTMSPSPTPDSSRSDSTPVSTDSPSQRPNENKPPPSPDSTSGARTDTSLRSKNDRRTGSIEDLAQEQERSAQRMEELTEEMQKTQREMSELEFSPVKEMEKMNQQLRREDLAQKMKENSRQLRNNQLEKARQGQRKMQQRLQSMRQRLNQMQQNTRSQQKRLNVSTLRTLLSNAIHLSKRQETLRNAIASLSTDGPAMRPHARDQNDLRGGLSTLRDSLQSVARRVPRMSATLTEETDQALQAMDLATSALENREADQASAHQKTAMTHVNEVALLLSKLLDSMQQQGMGQGLSAQQAMQQLQKMSGQQQKLNRQIQERLNEAQGERLAKEEAGREQDLAEEQRQLQKQLRSMDVGSDAENQIMGDLNQIADQMEESAQALENEDARHEEIRERQDQILTRLLNAQKSLRTQGKQEQRRGREADRDVDRRSPQELPDADARDPRRRDLMRALEMGYTANYEELIRRYFEVLEEDEGDHDEGSNEIRNRR